MTLMDKINDFESLKATMQAAEDQYRTIEHHAYIGFGGYSDHHMFMEDCNSSLGNWKMSWCMSALLQFVEDPAELGCYELDGGMDCLACAARNRSLATFLSTMFEDWEEFIRYLDEHVA